MRTPDTAGALLGHQRTPIIWLFLFFLLPFAIVLKISFAEAAIAIPPYHRSSSTSSSSSALYAQPGQLHLPQPRTCLYLSAYLGSLKIAFFSTLLCLLVGYPMAYAIARAPADNANSAACC